MQDDQIRHSNTSGTLNVLVTHMGMGVFYMISHAIAFVQWSRSVCQRLSDRSCISCKNRLPVRKH